MSLRILFVLPYVPSRIRVRPYQFIRHLAQAGHTITVAALADGQPGLEAVDELREMGVTVHVVPHSRARAAAQCLLALPTPTPLWAAYCRSQAMARLLRKLVAEQTFDVAHVEHLRAAHFAPALREVPTVFDAVDCITALRRQMLDQPGSGRVGRLLAYEEWVKLRRYEPRAYRAYARVAVTSPHDAEALINLGVPKPVRVIPNGVDLDYFCPDATEPEEDTLVFSGKMGYHANDDAARFLITEVMPRLRKRRPGVRLTIVGSGPTPALRALAEQEPGVTVTGFVEDLRPYLRGARVAVCPMRIGVGIQNKALEAMAVGRPVVCTSLVRRAMACAEKTGALRLADTPDDFARECASLLERPDEAEQAGRAARRYVEEYHRWAHAAQILVDVYQEARCQTGRL